MKNNPSFFAELQRRHVYKVGAMYCVAGWLLVQVVTQVLPVFDVSALGQRILVLTVVAGLPVALVLAWLFDITPQGIVRSGAAPAEETPVQARRRYGMEHRLNYVLGLLLLAALGYVGAEHLGRVGGRGAVAAAGNQSVAVLPFENFSEDKANTYFAEGIQDEILTRLAKIGALRVISRTSTQRYAGSSAAIGEIAQQLGVANLLEGSVQKSGNRVRINVQLIRAEGDQHLWAETYDRNLDDIFGVEGEVAGAIADAMGAKLAGSERHELTEAPTRSAAAYDAYLRGIALYRKGFADHDFRSATEAFEQAVAADPDFAQAWAQLSRGDSLLFFFGDDATARRKVAALHALEQAERLAPEALETQGARAYYTYRAEGDFDAALRQFEALHRRWPNDTETLTVMSYILVRQDRLDDAIARAREALRLDPLDVQLHKLLAMDQVFGRRYDEALASLDRVKALAPDDGEWRSMRADVLMAQGQLEQAAALLGPAPTQVSDEYGTHYQLARLQRRWQPEIQWLRQMQARPDDHALPGDWIELHVVLAELLRLAGDPSAMAEFRLARDQAGAELRRAPGNVLLLAVLAEAEAGLGDQAGALARMDEIERLAPESHDASTARRMLELRARLLLHFGQRDRALAILSHLLTVSGQSLYSSSPLTPALLRLDPDFDPIRGDPRFQGLLAAAAPSPAKP